MMLFLQELTFIQFFKIFFVKNYIPTNVNGVSASASATMSNLTLTLDKSGDVEVGTLVKLTAGKTNGSSTSSLVILHYLVWNMVILLLMMIL